MTAVGVKVSVGGGTGVEVGCGVDVSAAVTVGGVVTVTCGWGVEQAVMKINASRNSFFINASQRIQT
ncbi:MAG: hypothetical protein QY328_04830 [Anaerolineales bacterium]|nr:MAG: hypothetical protein QY328_04830 [Anaerolineales bacterium]